MSAFGWIRIAAMAVAVGDLAIEIVDPQFGALIAADLSAATNGIALRLVVAACAACAAALDVPTAIAIRDDMVGLRSSNHTPYPLRKVRDTELIWELPSGSQDAKMRLFRTSFWWADGERIRCRQPWGRRFADCEPRNVSR